jgi:hypothetical protein
VHEDMMWSRLPHAMHLLGRPRPPRVPRGGCPRPLCEPRPAATNAKMGGVMCRELSRPGHRPRPYCGPYGGCSPSLHQRTTCCLCRMR